MGRARNAFLALIPTTLVAIIAFGYLNGTRYPVDPEPPFGGGSAGKDTTPAVPPGPAGMLLVHIETLPADADLPWTLAVGVRSESADESTHDRREGRGATTLKVGDLPSGIARVLLESPQALGEICRDVPLGVGGATVTLTLRKFGCLHGEVIGPDGDAVARADVMLLPQSDFFEGMPRPLLPPRIMEPLEVRAAMDGRFSFCDLIPGRGAYFLAAVSPGFKVTRVGLVEVPPGAETQARILLEPGSRIVGRLLNSDGTPAVGVRVTVGEGTATDGRVRQWTAEGDSQSTAEGRFEFDGLGGGWKKVRAHWAEDGVMQVVQIVRECEVGVTTDLGEIGPTAGQLRLVFRVPEATVPKGLRVRLVSLPDGARENPWIFYLFPEGGQESRVDGIQPGEVRVLVADETIQATGFRRPNLTRSIHYRGGNQAVTLDLPAIETVEPEPSSEDMYPHPLELKLRGMKRGASFVLVQSGRKTVYVLPPAITSDGSRTLRIHNLPRGVHQVLYVSDGRYAEEEVRLEGEPTALELAPETRGVPLHVIVRSNTGPVRGARVDLRPSKEGRAGDLVIPLGLTDAEGALHFDGFPPRLEGVVEISQEGMLKASADVTVLAPTTTVELDLEP